MSGNLHAPAVLPQPHKLCTLLNCGTVTWTQNELCLEHQTSIPGNGNLDVQKLTFIFLTCVCLNSVIRTAQTEIMDTKILHTHTQKCTRESSNTVLTTAHSTCKRDWSDIFGKLLNIKFHENPFISSQVILSTCTARRRSFNTLLACASL